MGIDGKKLLIVDDSEDTRETFKVLLGAHGMEVVGAEDGEVGLARALSEKPDIIVLDVQMPKKDGFQTFSELRADDATKSIPIVMLTGVEERLGIGFGVREMGDFLGNEPEAYLEKPAEPQEIIETVCRVLGEELPG